MLLHLYDLFVNFEWIWGIIELKDAQHFFTQSSEQHW